LRRDAPGGDGSCRSGTFPVGGHKIHLDQTPNTVKEVDEILHQRIKYRLGEFVEIESLAKYRIWRTALGFLISNLEFYGIETVLEGQGSRAKSLI
jgi:hypothetical protein